jgi:anti-sigma-K factor RskA
MARHIEILLLEHDCVVIPGLGGFITNAEEARFLEQEWQMMPPYRTVRFNQALKTNDGLLVQSYMNIYDASYPAAQKQMQMDIDEMMDQLNLTGEYVMENIGTLRIDINHNISLETDESGINTPWFYGLSSFALEPVEAIEKQREIATAIQQTSVLPVTTAGNDEEKSKTVVVKFNRRWIDIAVSAAAAVMLFFLISYTSEPKATTDTLTASAVNISQQATDAEATAANGRFSLVMASYTTKANGEEYIQRLAEEGFKEGRFFEKGKMTRVLYGHYATAEEADEALHELRNKNSEFNQAWVLEVKE